MRFTNILLPLPAPLLLLLLATVQQPVAAVSEHNQTQWPYYLPAHVKYWPEDPPRRRRDLEAIGQQILAGNSPIGIKKMGYDEGEKFFVEYWQFKGSAHSEDFLSLDGPPTLPNLRSGNEALCLNGSLAQSFRHPFALHENKQSEIQKTSFAALLGRGSQSFTCPTGTLSCTNINQPSACCAADETCFTITDTGLGDVGCCPNGETCTGEEISCPANQESCPDNTGGGCCIPGFTCDGPGCIPSQSVVTVITTITINPTSHVITTKTIIATTSLLTTAPATDTSVQTTLSCSASYRACPITQGGGCCLTNRECGMTDCPTSSGSRGSTSSSKTETFTTATATAVVPVRPTSSSTITVFKSTGVSTAIATGNTCPIGFYGCSAVHQGGCCRTGRDCATTDCPATQSTTIVSAGETIVVPVGTGASLAMTTATGACASGWFSCASILGGGCCPSGFDCGTASCSSFSGTRTIEVGPKESTSGVGRLRRIGMKGWLGGVVGVCWVGGVVLILMMMWF